MIKLISRTEIDEVKWNACIDQASTKLVYGYSWYLDAVAEDWMALVSDDYNSVMPLVYRKKWGVNYLFQPFFCQQLGVFSKDRDLLVDDFLNAIPKKFKYWDINLNSNNVCSTDYEKLITYILDLNSSYDQISEQYSKNLKRNLKKAETSGIISGKEIDLTEIANLFRNDRGKTISSYKSADYYRLALVMRSLIQRQSLHYRTVRNAEGNAIAAIAIACYGKHRSFIFSGNSAEGKEVAAMPYLLDEFLRENSNKDLYMDFNGSVNPDLARFYKSFGSQESVYLRVRRNLLKPPLKWLKH